MKTPLTLCALALLASCGHHDTSLATYHPPLVSAGTGGSEASGGSPTAGAGAAAGAGGTLAAGTGGSGGDVAEGGSAGEPPGLVCPDTYTIQVPGLSSRYREATKGQPWVAAERDCAFDGGHLIVVDSEAENTWVAGVAALALTNNPSTHQLAWLGAGDSQAEGEFGWVTGEAVTTTYWNTAEPEPNDLNGAEDCVEIRGNAQWNDDRCNAPLIYVCECDGASSTKTWCDTSSEISCGDCSTVCAADQTCSSQQCR